MAVAPEVWAEIDKNWGGMLATFREQLPIQSHQMYDDTGNLVPSERPMIESIASDRHDRNSRFFFYVFAVQTDVAIKQSRSSSNRIICVNARSRIPLAVGGKGDKK